MLNMTSNLQELYPKLNIFYMKKNSKKYEGYHLWLIICNELLSSFLDYTMIAA